MQLQRSRSHERHNNPKTWELFLEGTADEIARAYEELTHASRMDSDWRVIDDDGSVMDLYEFFALNCK